MSKFTPSWRRQVQHKIDDLEVADFGISPFGVVYEMRLTEQNGKDDPYTFRSEFTASLKTQAKSPDSMKSVFHYDVVGKIHCPEFEVEDYFILKRKYLLFKHADQELMNSKPKFTIESIPWSYTPRSGDSVSSSEDSFKSAAAQALGNAMRANKELLDNIRTAIKSFFKILDAEIAAIVPQNIEVFKKTLGLEKLMGIYGREHTSNILGYLFGEQLQFYNGDEVRSHDGTLLVPSYWVRATEQDFGDKDKEKKYLGYGMKTAVVDFGFDPYPWAMIRINAIWNSIDKIIRAKVSFGQSREGSVSGQQVYIIAKRNEKMVFKALDKQYFANGKLADDRMEVLTSLALGQLEADHQELDLK